MMIMMLMTMAGGGVLSTLAERMTLAFYFCPISIRSLSTTCILHQHEAASKIAVAAPNATASAALATIKIHWEKARTFLSLAFEWIYIYSERDWNGNTSFFCKYFQIFRISLHLMPVMSKSWKSNSFWVFVIYYLL